MKARRIIGVIVLLTITACFLWLKWKHDEPRRYCLGTLQNLRAAIDTNPSSILDQIVVPEALTSRTPSEQTEFLSKTLRDEISADGIAALKRNASFGPLAELFPNESKAWTVQAGVRPEDCVAFKMERAGIRAEVVLVRETDGFRVVRCNNVKQMAMGGRSS